MVYEIIIIILMIGEVDHFLYASWSFVCLFCYFCCLATKLHSTHCSPRTVAHQAPQTMGFFRQEYWNGLPFPSPRNLPAPGIERTHVSCLPLSQQESLNVFLGNVCSDTLLISKSGCLFQPYGKPYEGSSQI